jgi:hypothetical protein
MIEVDLGSESEGSLIGSPPRSVCRRVSSREQRSPPMTLVDPASVPQPSVPLPGSISKASTTDGRTVMTTVCYGNCFSFQSRLKSFRVAFEERICYVRGDRPSDESVQEEIDFWLKHMGVRFSRDELRERDIMIDNLPPMYKDRREESRHVDRNEDSGSKMHVVIIEILRNKWPICCGRVSSSMNM